ncbi:hypothetical protein [Frankia sp. ACN1ag]|uniref:hypothetical protein n=1 Tax=Frankia sp. ACN1ag TaxID=102891 RepID=UPI0006DBEC2F|nr:hypothetical protein [Frankia sp. ACN1ag]KQC39049.1 hypothetical protein UK82_07690 [Frankia sp. ACN1ag]
MPGFLLHPGAQVTCSHGGQAAPTATNPRVSVTLVPTTVVGSPWSVAGCANPPNSGGPCTVVQWVVGTTRVTSAGQPLLIMGGQAICSPTPAPALTLSAQTRVIAT